MTFVDVPFYSLFSVSDQKKKIFFGSLALTSMRAKRCYSFFSLFLHFFVSTLILAFRSRLWLVSHHFHGLWSFLQFQIWVGSVAFALRSDQHVLYVDVLWCISVWGDLCSSSLGDLGGICHRSNRTWPRENEVLKTAIYRLSAQSIPGIFILNRAS